MPTPIQILSNTANEIRIERTAVIENIAFRIALPTRVPQYDAQAGETIKTEYPSNLAEFPSDFQQIQNNDDNSSSSDSSDNDDNINDFNLTFL